MHYCEIFARLKPKLECDSMLKD